VIVAAVGCGRSETPIGAVPETISNHATVSVRWEESLASAVQRARNENKAVLVNFYAEWCVWCQRMESTTLRDGGVAALLSERLVPVSLDVDAEGEELSTEYGVEALPTVLVLDASGRELGRIPGYLPPAGFVEAIESFLPES
jgi:thiol:disulfide interchange protein